MGGKGGGGLPNPKVFGHCSAKFLVKYDKRGAPKDLKFLEGGSDPIWKIPKLKLHFHFSDVPKGGNWKGQGYVAVAVAVGDR